MVLTAPEKKIVASFAEFAVLQYEKEMFYSYKVFDQSLQQDFKDAMMGIAATLPALKFGALILYHHLDTFKIFFALHSSNNRQQLIQTLNTKAEMLSTKLVKKCWKQWCLLFTDIYMDKPERERNSKEIISALWRNSIKDSLKEIMSSYLKDND